MNVLGISCFYHDAAAALVVDGELVSAAQEERFSRVKHDHEFPQNAIDFCLRSAGLSAQELDLVVFYEKPFWKLDRILASILQTFPRSLGAFREGMIVWLLDKLWVRDFIVERLGIPRRKVAFCAHHLSHACSAYFSSDFEDAAILTVDGVGEWATGTRGVASGMRIDIEERMSYPHSVGLLYSAFTAFLGFQVNEGEYKVMGLAPYGQARFVDLIFDKLVDLRDDGSFHLNMDYFAFHYSVSQSFNHRFVELFGRPRTFEESNTLDPHYADVAASIQKATEEILVRQARALHGRTRQSNLAMAGGVALNSVANARILRESGFERLFIQPAAGDDGGALGAALWGAYVVLREPRKFRMKHAYWGEAHADSHIADWLRDAGYEFRTLADDDALFDEVVARLTHGQVVGWMQGRFEWGPRALGHRSILADPRDETMKDIVNARIKFREPFRPFAPSVPAERVQDFFMLARAEHVEPARYMLLVVPVREDKKAELAAITHVDGTARIQAVHAAESPRYHGLIERFGQATGVPVLLNTSFNLRGEPIVNTPAEACHTFARSDMDALVMGHFLLSRRAIGEGRLNPVSLRQAGSDLDGWRHAPTASVLSPGGKPLPVASQAGVASAGRGHNLFGAIALEERKTGWTRVRSIAAKCAGSAILILVMLEIILRHILPMPNLQVKGMYRNDGNGVGLTPGWSRTVTGQEFTTPIAIDADGLRDADYSGPVTATPPAGVRRRLLVLGDSFTFGCWSTEDRRFVGVLKRALGPTVQVICGGNPNYGTDAELSFLRRHGDEMKPDAIVLAFYDGNDYWDNFVGQTAYQVVGGFLEMKEPWRSRELTYNCMAGSRSSSPRIGAFAPAMGQLSSPWGGTKGADPASVLDSIGALARHTEIYQLAAAMKLQFNTPPHFLRGYDAQSWMLKAYTPEMEQAVTITCRYLDGVQAECKRRGIALFLAVIPSSTEVDEGAWDEWLKANHLRNEAALFDRDKPRRLVLAWAHARGVDALDLAPDLMNRPDIYYKRDMHWTDRGHAVAGSALARFLQARGWPQ